MSEPGSVSDNGPLQGYVALVRGCAQRDGLAHVFCRAFLQVALVAWNVRNVAEGQYGLTFVTGAAVSWVWWANSKSAAHNEHPKARAAYAIGAGAGTVFGAWAGSFL